MLLRALGKAALDLGDVLLGEIDEELHVGARLFGAHLALVLAAREEHRRSEAQPARARAGLRGARASAYDRTSWPESIRRIEPWSCARDSATQNRGGQLARRSGGMADAADSKSAVRKYVRVRVPPSVPSSCGDLRSPSSLRDEPPPGRIGATRRPACATHAVSRDQPDSERSRDLTSGRSQLLAPQACARPHQWKVMVSLDVGVKSAPLRRRSPKANLRPVGTSGPLAASQRASPGRIGAARRPACATHAVSREAPDAERAQNLTGGSSQPHASQA